MLVVAMLLSEARKIWLAIKVGRNKKRNVQMGMVKIHMIKGE